MTRPTIRRGDKGSLVAEVQTCLLMLTDVDGDFGPQTEQAVRDFQEREKLSVDGVVGPATWSLLEQEYELDPYPPPVEPEQPSPATDISIVISSGHALHVRGASGEIDEVNEARRVVDEVARQMRAAGAAVVVFHDNTSTSQDQNLKTIVNNHNMHLRDLDVSVHFNAFETCSTPKGVEVLYVTQEALARKVSAAIAKAGGFIDRGPKHRSDLAFLNGTNEPAILIETCFVDSSADVSLYRERFTAICAAIAGSLPDPP